MSRGKKNYVPVLIAVYFLFASMYTPAFAMAYDFPESEVSVERTAIEGQLFEKGTGDPVPGAAVMVIELSRGAATDMNGRFEIPAIPHGIYTLHVQSLGYDTQTLQISHPHDGFMEIELTPGIIQAEELIFTGSPLAKRIQYQPAEAFNELALLKKAAPSLGEILDESPGVASRSFGSAPARPVIRGMDGDRLLVLQNGERMGDLSGTAVDHAVAIDPLDLSRVEIIRGPASLLYGSSAIAGIVNMFTDDIPREWLPGTGGRLVTHLASVNNMGSGHARLRHGSEKLAASGKLSYRQASNIRTPDGRLPDTDLNHFSYGAGLGYRNGDLQTGLSVNGLNYTYGLPEEIDDPDEKVEIRMNRTNLQSLSTMSLDGFFRHAEIRMQYTNYRHDEVEIETEPDGSVDEELEISFKQHSINSSLLLRHRRVGRMEGALGLSFHYSDLAVGGEEALTPDARSYFLAGYLYEEFRINRLLTIQAGGRVEFKETFVSTNELFTDASAFSDRSDLIFSGAAGLHLSPKEGWKSGLQIARGYRTPGVEELYSDAPHLAAGSYDIGDPTLANEISLGVDAFVEYRSNRTLAELSLFSNRFENYIAFTPTGDIHEPSGLPVFQYEAKDAWFYGFEFKSEQVIAGGLKAGLGLDYVRARERSGEQGDLAFIPPLRTQFSLSYEKNSWWTASRVRRVFEQNKVAPNEDPTDGYLLLGLDAGYRYRYGLTFSLRIDNLLNERYRDHLSRVEDRNYPMPGRNVNVMLRWDF